MESECESQKTLETNMVITFSRNTVAKFNEQIYAAHKNANATEVNGAVWLTSKLIEPPEWGGLRA